MNIMCLVFRFIVVISLTLSISSCGQINNATGICILDTTSKNLYIRVDNKTTRSFFLSSNSWLRNNGDTLFIESIYKPSPNGDSRIMYNQFSPPELNELLPLSHTLKKIDYNELKIKINEVVAVRVYGRLLPYDKDKDYDKFHSVDKFLEYENAYSTVLYLKVDKVNATSNW